MGRQLKKTNKTFLLKNLKGIDHFVDLGLRVRGMVKYEYVV